jgi:hypothetical protein
MAGQPMVMRSAGLTKAPISNVIIVWHNFVWINKKTNMTAAERIGLAKGKVRIEDIVYFDARSP